MVFVKKIEAFAGLPYRRFHCEKKHDIYFSDERIYAQYRYCTNYSTSSYSLSKCPVLFTYVKLELSQQTCLLTQLPE